MKFMYPEINNVFDTSIDKVHTIVIENQRLLRALINDLTEQISGFDGKCVISENGKVLATGKYTEVLKDYFPFEINRKVLVTKTISALVKYSLEYNYDKATKFISELEQFLNEETMNLTGDIYFQKVNLESIVRATGLAFVEDYESLGEKILDYFELVREYDRDKLFVLLNLRNFVTDDEADRFIETILRHRYNVIMIEGCEHTHLKNEKCYIIDKDMCEISI